jgi:hypothetical protein
MNARESGGGNKRMLERVDTVEVSRVYSFI